MRVCRKTVTLVTSLKKGSTNLIDKGFISFCYWSLFGYLAVTGDRFTKHKTVTLRSPKKQAVALVPRTFLFFIKNEVTAGDRSAVTKEMSIHGGFSSGFARGDQSDRFATALPKYKKLEE
jgi:hypothetical protein